jgi:hypothetical protein
MTGRLTFAAIALFWVVMNVLLWRSEFGGGRETVADVPVATVVGHVLDAADDSILTLRHHGQAIGQLRWNPSITENFADTNAAAANLPEGMVRAPAGHLLDVELNLFGDTPANRWRVLTRLDLDTNQVWRSFNLRVIQRPTVWEFSAVHGEERVRLRVEEGRSSSEQTFLIRDFSNPAAWLGPYAAMIPRNLLPLGPVAGGKGAPPGFEWSARNDWLRVGHNRVRVYRVRAKLFANYEAVAYFSRAGELLKVTLPDGLVLVNETLAHAGKD